MTTANVPTIEPVQATAGDSWLWTVADTDYPSSSYTLSYAINGVDTLPWSAGWSVINGNGFAVTIPAANTAPLTGGVYQLTKIYAATSGGNRFSLPCPPVTIADDPATVEPGDAQPYQEKALMAVEAQLSGKASAGMQMYTINGRQVMSFSLDELRKLRADLIRELNLIRRNGQPRRRLVTFSPVGGSFPFPPSSRTWG